jgi:hypothetical protein
MFAWVYKCIGICFYNLVAYWAIRLRRIEVRVVRITNLGDGDEVLNRSVGAGDSYHVYPLA